MLTAQCQKNLRYQITDWVKNLSKWAMFEGANKINMTRSSKYKAIPMISKQTNPLLASFFIKNKK